LSQEGSLSYWELKYRQLILSGIELQMQQLLTSFGALLENWLLERSSATINHSALMPNGTIDPSLLNTNTQLNFRSARNMCRNLTTGYVTTCLEVVSRARRICSRPFGVGGGPGAHSPRRMLEGVGSHLGTGPPAVKFNANCL